MPNVLSLMDLVFRPDFSDIKLDHQRTFQRVSPSSRGREAFLLHQGGVLAYSLSNVLFSWDVRGNYATKSTAAECVKRLCLGCVDELLAAFLKFPEADNLTECFRRRGGGGNRQYPYK